MSFSKLEAIVSHLLGPNGCPWDKTQTLLSLRHSLLEEACEIIDAISENDNEHIAEELGDLFFNLVLISKIGEKEGRFSWDLPIQKGIEKLIRRHPHIFHEAKALTPEGVKEQWEEIKKSESQVAQKTHLGIPTSLPALQRFEKLLQKMKKDEAFKTRCATLLETPREDPEEEVGRLLAGLVASSIKKSVHPEEALRKFFCVVAKDQVV